VASGDATKQDVRAAIRLQRSARPESARISGAAALAERAMALLPDGAVTVTAYQSMAQEPGTGPLINAILARGLHVLLPRIDGRELRWVEVRSTTQFTRGPLGIMEPEGPALGHEPSPLLGADVLFLPGLAVDHTGRRLGQGGGYYDKALAAIPAHADGGPLRVAVLFDDEYVERVPSEDHDCSVDAVITERRMVRVER
jgi:5-formyltetrahydrofolate cyclo-ligase